MLLGEFIFFEESEDLVGACEDGVGSFERIFSEISLEDCMIFSSASFPLCIAHGDLIHVGE